MVTNSASEQGQARWDRYGLELANAIRDNPSAHLIRGAPVLHWQVHRDLMVRLRPLRQAKLLELGCGTGHLAVYLAQQGADMTALDVGPHLVEAARMLASVNETTCDFVVGSATSLPFPAESFDRVFGLAILHHLHEDAVSRAMEEVHRVLKPGGTALFYEPVENSRIFACLQNLIPVGERGSKNYRPSILNRRAWRTYVTELDDRDMTATELVQVGQNFRSVEILPYGFLSRLERLVGRGHRNTFLRIDKRVFTVFPPARYLCQTVLAVYSK